MLHLAIICMVCAVLAPIEGPALIGVNNTKSNSFCHVDEREQRQRGKSFPGLYNADVKNRFDCAKQQVTGRTHWCFCNNVTKQCQFDRTLYSFRNRKKRNSNSGLEYTVQRRNIYGVIKNKGKMLIKKLTNSGEEEEEEETPERAKPFVKLTSYERKQLRHLKRVGKKRKKRRTRKSHLDKVEIDDDLDMDKRIEKLVERIALENMRTQENPAVSPAGVTEPIRVGDLSTGHSEDSTKGLAFPFFNNIKQMFRFSREYFDSERDSRDVTVPIKPSQTMSERESENPKSMRLRRSVIRRRSRNNGNRLGRWVSTQNPPNRVVFSAVKRKRRRRKRDHRHHRPRLDSTSKHRVWPLFNQKYPKHKTNYNNSNLKEDNVTNSTGSQTGLPPLHNPNSINHGNNFSITDSESITYKQGNGSSRTRYVLHDSLDAKRSNNGHRTSGFPHDKKLLISGRYLKIRHALRNYIHHNNDWTLEKRLLMDRKKRCEGKCNNNMPHKCWRSAPLLCIPYIRKGQDELLKYIIKTLQNMLGKPMPRKIDIFEKTKFKPCLTTPETTCEDIMAGCENESTESTETTETIITTFAPTTTTSKPTLPSPSTLPPLPSTTLLQPYTTPATECTNSTVSSATTNCPSVEAVTTYSASFSFLLQSTTLPPSTTASPPPVTSSSPLTYPQPVTNSTPTTNPPSTTTTTCAPTSPNTYALVVIGSATTIFPPAGPYPKDSGKDYPNDVYSTETTILQGTEPSTPMPQQQQTQLPITYFQITVEDEKCGDVIPSGNGVTTASPNTPLTTTVQGYNFPMPPPKVTPRELAQGYTTVPPHVAVASSQEIRPPTTQSTPRWYFSDSPIEKSEILTFTTLDCDSSSNPDLCYKYYQPFTPSSSNERHRDSHPIHIENQQNPYNMYVYKTDMTPTMGPGSEMPLEFDLAYNDKAKPRRDFIQSDTMTDNFPESDPRGVKRLRGRNFVEPSERFKLKEEENLFPGDPFAYRYMGTSERYPPRMMRPRLFRNKFPKFIQRSNRKPTPNYDFDVDEPLSRNQQRFDEKYDRHNSPEMSGREFNERIRKTPKKNQRREKREVFYRDNYPWSQNSDNNGNYPEDSNYDDQYPENLLLPNLNWAKTHWARKREEGQNTSTPGTFALFSELVDIATLSTNETEKVNERSANTTSTESATKTVTNPLSSPQIGPPDKFDNQQRSGYENSQDPTVPILSDGQNTTQIQIPATVSDDTTTANSVTTTLENKGSTHASKSNEVQKAQIVDSGKPAKEVGSNHDLEAGEDQIMTTLKTASIVKGPKKLFTKPAPKVYTKVYPDSLPNELETNETPTISTTPKPDKTTVVQTLAPPDVRLQLLAVCEGYLEVVKLIKAQNQSLEEELDSDLSRYCENIISQSFNLPADNVIIKGKKPENSPSSVTMTTPQVASKNSNKLISKRRSGDRYRPKKDEFSHQDLRAKVVVDILRSPLYKKELATYADQNNFYSKGRKTKRMSSQPVKMNDKRMSGRRCRYKERVEKDFSKQKIGVRNKRKKLRRKEKFSKERISEEEMELLHLLRKRKRALLSWLSSPKENQIEPNDLEETEYLDDDEYYTITAETTEDSGTITPKGDQETSEPTTKTTFYASDTIFPVYAKRYGYDRGGELREVEVLWRRVNEETHEKKIFKNMSVLALLLTSTMAPYMKRKESKFVSGNAYDAEEMSEIESNSDNRAGLVDPSASLNKKPVTKPVHSPSHSTAAYFVSFKPEFKQFCIDTTVTINTTVNSTTSSVNTTPATTIKSTTLTKTTTTTEHQTEIETVGPNNSSKKNQTYIFMRKPDPSTIVGSPPNSTKGQKNSTHKMSRKFEIAKDFFEEYSIEFLNYAVYILPIMFTILFLMCCLCCFLQILNSRGGGEKKKKRVMNKEEDFDTTGESEGETKIRKKKKWKKSQKTDVDSENSENRRLRAFWNVLKMNSRGKPREDVGDEASTPTEKRRSFLQFLKGKRGAVEPEELASLSYPPPGERDEGSDEEAGMRLGTNVINDEFESGMKETVREKKEADERREIISLLEELKKIELENLEEQKNKNSVCVQYMTQDEEKTTVFARRPDIPSTYHVNKYFGSNPFSDKRLPNPPTDDLQEEFMELVPYGGDYTERKNDSLRHSDYRLDRGGRCERFFKMFRRSRDGINFMKSGTGNKSYIYTKYKNISTDTADELMGGTRRNADTDKNLSDELLNNFPPYSLHRNKETDIVDEMENLKRQLNKKKNVRLKDNGVLCRL